MARFRYRACGQEDTFTYKAGPHTCPRCGSPDVQFAISIDELPNEFFDQLIRPVSKIEPEESSTEEDC